MVNKNSNYFLIKDKNHGISNLFMIFPSNYGNRETFLEILVKKDSINTLGSYKESTNSIFLDLNNCNQIMIVFDSLELRNDYFEKLKNFLLLTE